MSVLFILIGSDDFFCILCGDFLKASEGLAISLDDFLKHGLRPCPNASFAVHRLIYDHLLEGFRMLRYVKDTIYVALEVSVVFSCHENKDTILLQKLCIFESCLCLTA